ncbi:hypothetical protein FB451DRAFT_1207265 [Mycena latifolia]|nr:hypothetical protein FB451DRAFT_1207265 [Mycena latifolia]
MDSQLTLVDPAPVSLIFDSNSMTNATLRINSAPAYTISTDSRGTTEIRAAGTDDVLARIMRKGLLPDTISFPTLDGGKELRQQVAQIREASRWSVSVEPWLPCPPLINAMLSPVCVVETDVGKYFLRNYLQYRLALFTEHDLDNPVAYLQRPTVATRVPLALVLQPGTEHFRAQIIAAFIIQEQKTRAEEEAQRAEEDRANVQYKRAIYGPGPSHRHG